MKTNRFKKYIINIILISVILGILSCIIIEKIRDNNIEKENEYNTERLSIDQNNTNSINQENLDDKTILNVKEYPKEKILDTYKGYKVCAKLEIPVISLEVNILSNYSVKALKVSATKFWGVEPNQNGNFCIAGHNTKNMFSNIKKLKLGDSIFLTDREVGKVEYEIFNIDKVIPEDVECLDPITNNEKEVTLITCTSDSKKRIIVKAKEKI